MSYVDKIKRAVEEAKREGLNPARLVIPETNRGDVIMSPEFQQFRMDPKDADHPFPGLIGGVPYVFSADATEFRIETA